MGRKRGVNFRLGSFYRSDDRSGFVRRAEHTRMEWQGLIVGKDLWEIRQPQDFVRGVPDNQNVPDPRSQLATPFDGPVSTQLARAASPGDAVLYLDSTAGFSASDKVGVMTSDGSYFNTAVLGAPTSSTITITAPMPLGAPSGNVVTNYGAVGP